METKPLAIQVRSLQKTFRIGLRRKRQDALRGLDLEVAQGEIFGFLGPNGAGKTTTIKILLDLLRADRGQASLLGRDTRDPASRLRVAYLPELPDFYDYLTPAEFLTDCGALSKLAPNKVRERIPMLLAKVGLDPREKRQLRKFSKGMLQRIGIAQTMLADPDLFILDEPMSGLDPIGRRWVKDLISELGKAGKTVFFSSHILAEAESVCTRVAFINRGQQVAQGSLSEILQSHIQTQEIVVEGSAIREDPAVTTLVSRTEANGSDTLLELAPNQDSNQALQWLLAHGHRIRSCAPRHATLEEVFLRTLQGESKQGEE
jgi:ABC-2 type transport system ATP-binding protein